MKNYLLLLSILFTCQLRAADYYWVGGGGSWSDLNHWRLGSSAGPIAGIVPAAGDNVFFDANSGFGTTVATRTVTLDANGFCNNMTWSNVPNNPIFNTANSAFTVEVWGNMALSPTTSYTCLFKFRGTTPATITTIGVVQGAFGFEIDKPGSSLAVTDSLIVPAAANVPTSYITLTAGTFNIAGKKVRHFRFLSENSNTRTLEMTNADVTFGYYYNFRGANKTLNASGSTLYATGWIYMDGGTYPKVFNDAVANNTTISNTTIGSLTFRNTSAPLSLGINDGNTIDSLISKGSVSIGSNNNINLLIAAGGVSAGSNNQIDSLSGPGGVTVGSNNTIPRVISGGHDVMGTGNTIGYWQNGGHFTVSGTGTNNLDSLLLTPGKIIKFSGTFYVNKYLKLDGNTCDAFSEVSGDSTAGSLNFAAGATATMNNMTLTGLKTYGPITPLAVAGIDNGGNAGFTITPPAAAGGTRYWVAGAGDWNDRSHWSTTSGGAGGACVPYIGDDVVFDANSGFAPGNNTVTTSSSAFCHNMTWATGVGTATFTESGSHIFRIYGSLAMQPVVTMNAVMEFHGSDPTSIITNASTLGGLHLHLKKTGGAVVTLTDNWTNTSAVFVHHSGGLNLSGRTVNLWYYSSALDATRSVNISNATLNFTGWWDYRGAGKSIVSSGSHITLPVINTDGLNYPWVDVTGPATPYIINTTFGQLTFTDASVTSSVGIGGNNTIRRIEFKGKGVMNGGGNSIDTLLLAGSRNYTFAGTNTINKYLQAVSAPCAGLSEIKGNPTGTLAFAGGAVANLSNIYMQNMTASGPITPIAFNGADAGGNSGWTINTASGGARYWVAGAGDWNDPNHWSATSGGAGGTACVPTVYDDVYFDAGSGFTAVSKTVTINNGNAYCRNINWTGAPNSPVWSKSASWALEVWGDSVILNPAATFSVAPLVLKGSNATYMKGAAPAGNFDITIDKTGGSLTLLDNYSNAQTHFNFTNGAFNAPGKTVNVDNISNYGSGNAFSVDISNATITTNGWGYHGPVAAHALNATNSTITTPLFVATGLTYNKINASGAGSAQVNNTTIDSLIFTNPSTTSAAGITGSSNILNHVEYKGSGGIYSTGNTIDTLVFFPGNTYTLNAGTNTTITGEWYGSGTPCRATEIVSSATPAGNATVTKTSGEVNFDYVRLRRITAAGAAAPFIARSHSTDLGNNTNWNIAPYDGASPIYGLGPDTAIAAGDFPVTLRTDGFFGSPSSTYLWSNSSTADTLQVAGPGTYGVSVSLADGCNINDQITITFAATLPVTLVSFTARQVDCQPHLNWKVADALNFSRFEVEKSMDGHTYTRVAAIPLTTAVDYAWTDKVGDNPASYYRLKMVDIDEEYAYSSVVPVKNNCQVQTIKVYPTVTDNRVQVTLPQGYERAAIQVFNISGQRINALITGSGSGRIVNLQGLPKATYVLQVINGTERKNFTIIKP